MADEPKRRRGRPETGRVIPVMLRVSEETLKLLDEKRGDLSRAAYLEKLVVAG